MNTLELASLLGTTLHIIQLGLAINRSSSCVRTGDPFFPEAEYYLAFKNKTGQRWTLSFDGKVFADSAIHIHMWCSLKQLS